MTSRTRHTRLVLVLLWSVVVWVALWSDLSLANVLWGLVAGALTCVLVPLRHTPRQVSVSPIGLLRFVGYAAWALVRASAVVAWEIVTPGNRIHQGIVAVPLRTTSPALITLVANVISLTPGTLTLEVHAGPTPTLYVHVLHLGGVEEARAEMRHLEDLVLRAFPGVTATEEPAP